MLFSASRRRRTNPRTVCVRRTEIKVEARHQNLKAMLISFRSHFDEGNGTRKFLL